MGPQPNENVQQESDDEEEGIKADSNLVSELVTMGFSENGCKRAAIAVKNASLEAAMDWVLTHMDDADFNAPIESETSSARDAFSSFPSSEAKERGAG